MQKPILIAEVKTCSPFGFQSEKSWGDLFELANKFGDIISIHTDPRWGGSFDLLKKARKMTDKPILAKGIHSNDDDIREAINLGADYVLVVGRQTDVFKEKCLFEPLNLREMALIPQDLKVVWNSRDLSNGEDKLETFEEAREIFKGWLCQASNIKEISDVKVDADAILVGTHLEEFIDSR